MYVNVLESCKFFLENYLRKFCLDLFLNCKFCVIRLGMLCISFWLYSIVSLRKVSKYEILLLLSIVYFREWWIWVIVEFEEGLLKL